MGIQKKLLFLVCIAFISTSHAMNPYETKKVPGTQGYWRINAEFDSEEYKQTVTEGVKDEINAFKEEQKKFYEKFIKNEIQEFSYKRLISEENENLFSEEEVSIIPKDHSSLVFKNSNYNTSFAKDVLKEIRRLRVDTVTTNDKKVHHFINMRSFLKLFDKYKQESMSFWQRHPERVFALGILAGCCIVKAYDWWTKS